MTDAAAPPSGHALDDKPRPPRRPGPRLRYWVAGVLCVGAVGYLIFGGLGSNIVYFRTTSEAVARRTDDGSHRFRLAGAVVLRSVRETGDGVEFDVTDGRTIVHVRHTGDEPSLFKEGAPVVCEGRWEGDRFASDRILIKHGAEYRPPSVSQTTTAP